MKKLLIILIPILFILNCTEPKSKENSTQPNIVYILADDMGYGDLGCYNPDSKIKTPNIDAIAAAGMRFTDAHSPSSVCTPTRYGILTGRYCWRSRLPQGVLRGYGRSLIEEDRTTVGSFLQEQGYTTGVVGKWHLGLDWVIKAGHEDALESKETSMNEVGMVTEMNPEHLDFTKKPTDGPLNHGFNYSFILPASLDMDPYCYLENDQLTEIPSDHTPGNDLNTGYTGAFWRAGLISPGFDIGGVLPTFTDKAIGFIEEQAQSEDPFFLYMPLAAPHTPWMPSQNFEGKSEAGQYGDFVSMVDAMVGRVLNTLEAKGLSDNTLVIFTSDNGPFWTPALIEEFTHRSAGPLRGMKADAFEGGHRIPFIAKWPGHIPANSTSGATTTLTNLLATVADLHQQSLDEQTGEDSHSILPILTGKAEKIEGQEAVIHHSSRGFFVVRKGDWKLILGRGSGGFSAPQVIEIEAGEVQGQLYNLKEDLAETNDLYSERPEIVTELKGILERYQQDDRSR